MVVDTTPFELVYGCDPLIIQHYVSGASKLKSVDNKLATKDNLLKELRVPLLKP